MGKLSYIELLPKNYWFEREVFSYNLTSKQLWKEIVYIQLVYLSSLSERHGWSFLPKNDLMQSEVMSVRRCYFRLPETEDSQAGRGEPGYVYNSLQFTKHFLKVSYLII